MELFSKPAVGGIIEKNISGIDHILIQERYKVLNYAPFSCCQNIQGTYLIMVQTFICKADGELLKKVK